MCTSAVKGRTATTTSAVEGRTKAVVQGDPAHLYSSLSKCNHMCTSAIKGRTATNKHNGPREPCATCNQPNCAMFSTKYGSRQRSHPNIQCNAQPANNDALYIVPSILNCADMGHTNNLNCFATLLQIIRLIRDSIICKVPWGNGI